MDPGFNDDIMDGRRKSNNETMIMARNKNKDTCNAFIMKLWNIHMVQFVMWQSYEASS